MIVRCSIDDGHGGQFEVEVSDDGYRIGGIKVAPEVDTMLDAEILGPFAKPGTAMVSILIDLIRHSQGHKSDCPMDDCRRLVSEVRDRWNISQRKTR